MFTHTSVVRHKLTPILLFQGLVLCFWRDSPPVGYGLLVHEDYRAHTTTHHSRWESPGRVISSSQRPLPDNTYNTHDRHPCPWWESNWQYQQASGCRPTPKAPYTLSVKLSDFTVWRHTWRKIWVNCSVLTGNSADLRTVFSSSLSHGELRSSVRVSHSFLNLPVDTTMASSQGTSVPSNSFSRWATHDIFLFKYRFLLHILRFLFFFSYNVMADVASKQQTTALCLSTTVTRTKRHTELTPPQKTDKPDGKPLLCQRTFSSVFRAVFFFYTIKLHSLT